MGRGDHSELSRTTSLFGRKVVLRRSARSSRSKDTRERFKFVFFLFCGCAFDDRRRADSEDYIFRDCANCLDEVCCANDVRILMGVRANVMARIAFSFAGFLGCCDSFFTDVDCGLAGQFFGDALSGFGANYFVNVIAFRAFRRVGDASMDCAAAQSSAFFSDDADYAGYVVCAIFLLFRLCFEDDAGVGGYCAA